MIDAIVQLLRLDPRGNSLCLVYRERRTFRFTRYISCANAGAEKSASTEACASSSSCEATASPSSFIDLLATFVERT